MYEEDEVEIPIYLITGFLESGKTSFINFTVAQEYFQIDGPTLLILSLIHIFGQLREWSEEREIDWFLLADEGHQHLQTFFSDLLKMYRKYPALYANDCGYEGFQWINANDGDRSIYSFVRWSPTGKNNLLFVCNFTPVERPDYMLSLIHIYTDSGAGGKAW